MNMRLEVCPISVSVAESVLSDTSSCQPMIVLNHNPLAAFSSGSSSDTTKENTPQPKGKAKGGKGKARSPNAGGKQTSHGGGYHNSHQTGDALMALFPRGARGPARVSPSRHSAKNSDSRVQKLFNPDISDGSKRPRRRINCSAIHKKTNDLSKSPRRREHDAPGASSPFSSGRSQQGHYTL